MARPRGDIAPRILHAARARFLLEGVDGASLRRIAADAGTSIGMVYYYYPTKDELFFAVVEEIYAKFLADLEQVLTQEASAEERLRALYARAAAMTDDELTVVRVVVREVLLSSSRLERLVARFSTGHLPLVVKMLLEGVAEGHVTDQHHPAVLVASTFALALAPQVMRRMLGGRLPAGIEVPSADALAAEMHDVLLHGIGARPEARKR
jgi:AcrR family transcriptional regulator